MPVPIEVVKFVQVYYTKGFVIASTSWWYLGSGNVLGVCIINMLEGTLQWYAIALNCEGVFLRMLLLWHFFKKEVKVQRQNWQSDVQRNGMRFSGIIENDTSSFHVYLEKGDLQDKTKFTLIHKSHFSMHWNWTSSWCILGIEAHWYLLGSYFLDPSVMSLLNMCTNVPVKRETPLN